MNIDKMIDRLVPPFRSSKEAGGGATSTQSSDSSASSNSKASVSSTSSANTTYSDLFLSGLNNINLPPGTPVGEYASHDKSSSGSGPPRSRSRSRIGRAVKSASRMFRRPPTGYDALEDAFEHNATPPPSVPTFVPSHPLQDALIFNSHTSNPARLVHPPFLSSESLRTPSPPLSPRPRRPALAGRLVRDVTAAHGSNQITPIERRPPGANESFLDFSSSDDDSEAGEDVDPTQSRWSAPPRNTFNHPFALRSRLSSDDEDTVTSSSSSLVVAQGCGGVAAALVERRLTEAFGSYTGDDRTPGPE